jgi:hypothetical protein
MFEDWVINLGIVVFLMTMLFLLRAKTTPPPSRNTDD